MPHTCMGSDLTLKGASPTIYALEGMTGSPPMYDIQTRTRRIFRTSYGGCNIHTSIPTSSSFRCLFSPPARPRDRA